MSRLRGALASLIMLLSLSGCGTPESGSSPLPNAPRSTPVATAAPVPASDQHAAYPLAAAYPLPVEQAHTLPSIRPLNAESQTAVAFGTVIALRRMVAQQTAVARGPITPAPLTTDVPDIPIPPADATPLPGGGILVENLDSYPYEVMENVWFFKHEGKRYSVYAGVTTYRDESGVRHKTNQGVVLLDIRWDSPYGPGFPDQRLSGSYPTPSTDGPARIIDAHIKGDQFLATVETAGGSRFIFDVMQRTFSTP